jgi:pimeloyl-ACP methyl ester carboxylesterase
MSPNRAHDVLRKSIAWTVVVVAAAATTVSCGKMVDGRPLAVPLKVGDPIHWRECKTDPSESVHIPKGAECGVLAVPVDYTKPDGDVARLALIRFPAAGPKIGSLVINPGGPGESGIDAAVSLVDSLPPQVHDRFDLVGFDPRGVGSSTPAVFCNSDADNDRLRADPQVDYSPAGVAHIDSQTKAFVQRCIDKMGKAFLANVGTVSVAKDLDALRAALGDEKLTYLGYSYGTRIGSAYAEAFPQNVRAMILDGAVDPNADPVQSDIDQSAAFQKAFDDYAADCATQPGCPLGADPAKAVAVYQSLVDPLVDKPVKTDDPRGLGYSDAIVGTILPLYSPNLWPHLTQGLKELAAGHGDTLLELADLYMGRDADGHYSNATDARVAVNCVDQPAVTNKAAVIDEDRRTREVAPFMNYGHFTGDAPMGTCAFWPLPPTSTPHQISVKGLPPIMVVSTTHDPATPYQAGVDLARELGGSLVTFEGTQHTVVFQGNNCIDDIAAKYLIDVTVPSPGTRC